MRNWLGLIRTVGLMLAIGLASTPVTAAAQEAPRRLTEGLELTAQQRAAISALGARTKAARATILARGAGGKAIGAADWEELRALGEEHNRQLRALLTPAQLEQLETNVAAIGEALAAKRNPRGDKGRGGAR